MGIKISTDSTADIPLALREELNINVVGLPLMINGKEYLDGYDITPQDIYAHLDKDEKLPTHAQLPPFVYVEMFERFWREGYSELIHVTINAKGSATYQTTLQAREMFFEANPEARENYRIHIIDSRTYSMVYGWAVIEAARMSKADKPSDEIIAFIEDWLENVRVMFVPMSLRCVRKSGRVTAAAALIGDAMGLKPVITFEDGESKILAKVRGQKKVIAHVIDKVCRERRPGTPYAIARGSSDALAVQFRSACEAAIGEKPVVEYPLGCIISINTGSDVLGILYRV